MFCSTKKDPDSTSPDLRLIVDLRGVEPLSENQFLVLLLS